MLDSEHFPMLTFVCEASDFLKHKIPESLLRHEFSVTIWTRTFNFGNVNTYFTQKVIPRITTLKLFCGGEPEIQTFGSLQFPNTKTLIVQCNYGRASRYKWDMNNINLPSVENIVTILNCYEKSQFDDLLEGIECMVTSKNIQQMVLISRHRLEHDIFSAPIPIDYECEFLRKLLEGVRISTNFATNFPETTNNSVLQKIWNAFFSQGNVELLPDDNASQESKLLAIFAALSKFSSLYNAQEWDTWRTFFFYRLSLFLQWKKIARGIGFVENEDGLYEPDASLEAACVRAVEEAFKNRELVRSAQQAESSPKLFYAAEYGRDRMEAFLLSHSST